MAAPLPIPVYNAADPRDPTLAKAFIPPTASFDSLADLSGVAAMVLAGGAMVTRKLPFAWLSILMGFTSVINTREISVKSRASSSSMGSSGWSALLFGGTALFSLLTPILTGQVVPGVGGPLLSTPLS